jgi:hypothetical protein
MDKVELYEVGRIRARRRAGAYLEGYVEGYVEGQRDRGPP